MKEYQKLAATLITNSRGSGQAYNYQLGWWRGTGWGYERLVDSFANYVREILIFVAFLYENGYEYNSENYHRTAIFAHNIHVSNKV